MKAFITFLGLLSTSFSFAQNSTVKLTDLAVPASPAFMLLDATPSLIQTPNTPKAFVLGIAQSFQQSSGGFPQDYSAEFTPYWWVKPTSRNIYNLLGLQPPSQTGSNPASVMEENPFSGLKFAAFSIGFFNQDLIPDSISLSQKIISVGARATLIKIHRKGYGEIMLQKIQAWHNEAQKEMDNNIELLTEISRHPEKADELNSKFVPLRTGEILKEINELINQKPVLAWDIAAAYATYGVADTAWTPGRQGIWSTLSSYMPINSLSEGSTENYFNLNLSLRYLLDNYHKNDFGVLSKRNCLDVGGKIAFEIAQLSIGLESLYRFVDSGGQSQKRTVGIFNYKVADNLYIHGAFGKNFDGPNKLIALFGINWGFGNETVKLEDI